MDIRDGVTSCDTACSSHLDDDRYGRSDMLVLKASHACTMISSFVLAARYIRHVLHVAPTAPLLNSCVMIGSG